MTDYPGALWVPAFAGKPGVPGNYRKAQRTTIDLIVIHCTDGQAMAEATAERWAGPLKKRSSAHFAVGQNGTVIQAVRCADIAFHAHDAANAISIGIEHCARTPGELGPTDPGLPPSMAQYAASAMLVAWLCRFYGKPRTRGIIVGHAEADKKTTHTRCPLGCGWSWEKYMPLVQGVVWPDDL